jgi:hypothetical protein
MYSFMHPSNLYYSQKDFISNAKFSIGKYMLWLVGLQENLTEEMENIFISNNHTMLLQDKNLRKKYESYLDVKLIPERYKSGRKYYEIYKKKKIQNIAFPNKMDKSNILLKNKELADRLKVLLTEEASPGLAAPELLKLLPKTYFIMLEWDTLKDQGLIYAERLKSNGVDVKVAFYENAYHGMIPFIDSVGGYSLSRDIFEDLVKYIKHNI